MESIIVGAALAGSFGAAFAMQKMALGLLLKAMGKPLTANQEARLP